MDKISLRELVFDDLKWLHAIRNDPETYKWLHRQHPFSLKETIDWFYRQNAFLWVALLDEVPFGYFRTDKVDYAEGSIEIGMDIAIEFRGKGLAIPSYKKFINLLKSQGFQTFTLEVLEHNTRAIHLYEKLGFVFQSRYPYPVRGFAASHSVLMKLTLDKS